MQRRTVHGVLKGLITEPLLMIEQKGIDPVQWPNRVHVAMAANADWVVPASAGERRYAVFKCASIGKTVLQFLVFHWRRLDLSSSPSATPSASNIRRLLGQRLRQRAHETGNEFDQISLTLRAGFFEHALQMRPDRGFGYSQRRSHFGYAADLDHGKENAHLGGRELEHRAIASNGTASQTVTFCTKTAATAG